MRGKDTSLAMGFMRGCVYERVCGTLKWGKYPCNMAQDKLLR